MNQTMAQAGTTQNQMGQKTRNRRRTEEGLLYGQHAPHFQAFWPANWTRDVCLLFLLLLRLLHCLVAFGCSCTWRCYLGFYFLCFGFSFLLLPAFGFDHWSGRVACVFPMFQACFGFVKKHFDIRPVRASVCALHCCCTIVATCFYTCPADLIPRIFKFA